MAGRETVLVAQGLAAFGQALGDHRAREAAAPPGRLLAFLERYRALAPRKAEPRREDRLLGLDMRLPVALAALAPSLAAARSAGIFANVWAVAGLRRDEVRTASVLCWLLDPRGSHGRGPAFSEALWSVAGCEALGFSLAGLRRATTEVCPLGDQSNRVDIALEGDDFLVFIEVKVDAGLQPDQLQRYATAADNAALLRGKAHAAVIYLSPWGAELPDRCLHATWRHVARAIRHACPGTAGATFIDQAALQFAAHVETLH